MTRVNAHVVHADNLPALLNLELAGVVVDLAYLDPPFFTGRSFAVKDGRPAYGDRWRDREHYLDELGARLLVVHRMLAPHGSLVVHLDPRVVHHVKVRCDAAWGDAAFAGEIVWRYRRWPTKTPNFQAMHDVLLRYRKDPKVAPRWNQLYEPLAASTVATWGTRRQRAAFVDGRRARSTSTDEESRGAPMSDVWDVGIIAPVARERTSFPTQKPEALLERIVGALSNPGDLVLDPYMGSGTTLAVARRMGRRSIGIDASDVAVEVAARRLGTEVRKRVAR